MTVIQITVCKTRACSPTMRKYRRFRTWKEWFIFQNYFFVFLTYQKRTTTADAYHFRTWKADTHSSIVFYVEESTTSKCVMVNVQRCFRVEKISAQNVHHFSKPMRLQSIVSDRYFWIRLVERKCLLSTESGMHLTVKLQNKADQKFSDLYGKFPVRNFLRDLYLQTISTSIALIFQK